MELDYSDRLLVIIPAYNEAESIQKTVTELNKECPNVDYIVVDDGSLDCTAAVCLENGYPLLQLPVNLGLSGAFQAGARYANRMGYGYCMQLDADGQHMPQYIPDMLKAARQGADVVIGSRYYGKHKEHSMRRVGGKLLQGAIWLTTGKKITDPTSGMRLYNGKLIADFFKFPNFDPEPDMIAYLIHRGYAVQEVEVCMRERLVGQSYLRFGRVIQYMMRMMLSILLIQWFRKG